MLIRTQPESLIVVLIDSECPGSLHQPCLLLQHLLSLLTITNCSRVVFFPRKKRSTSSKGRLPTCHPLALQPQATHSVDTLTTHRFQCYLGCHRHSGDSNSMVFVMLWKELCHRFITLPTVQHPPSSTKKLCLLQGLFRSVLSTLKVQLLRQCSIASKNDGFLFEMLKQLLITSTILKSGYGCQTT